MLVFNHRFRDAEMFSIGWIRDCRTPELRTQSAASEPRSCSSSARRWGPRKFDKAFARQSNFLISRGTGDAMKTQKQGGATLGLVVFALITISAACFWSRLSSAQVAGAALSGLVTGS